MKKFLALSMIALALVGCGKDGSQGVQGAPGAPGAPGADAPTPKSFAGFYALPNGGYMEIVEDSGKLNDLTQIRLVMQNADGSYGIMPLSSLSNLPTTNDEIIYYANLSYTAATHNIRTDAGASQLNGSFFTLVTVSKADNKLKVRVQVSSGATVVFDHTISE